MCRVHAFLTVFFLLCVVGALCCPQGAAILMPSFPSGVFDATPALSIVLVSWTIVTACPENITDASRYAYITIAYMKLTRPLLRENEPAKRNMKMTEINAQAKMYDFGAKRTVTMPVEELTPEMRQAHFANAGETAFFDPSQILPGPFRHEPFTGTLRKQVLFIQKSFRRVYPLTYKQWEDGFRRDLHAAQEIGLWSRAAKCYNACLQGGPHCRKRENEAFAIILGCLGGAPQAAVAASLQLSRITRVEAETMISAFYSEGSAPPILIGHG